MSALQVNAKQDSPRNGLFPHIKDKNTSFLKKLPIRMISLGYYNILSFNCRLILNISYCDLKT